MLCARCFGAENSSISSQPKGLNKTEKIAYNRVTYEGSTFWIVHIVGCRKQQWRKKRKKIILSLLLSSECEIVKCISRSSMYHTHLLKHQKSVNSHTQRDLGGEFTYVPSPGYLVNKYPFHYVNRGNMRSAEENALLLDAQWNLLYRAEVGVECRESSREKWTKKFIHNNKKCPNLHLYISHDILLLFFAALSDSALHHLYITYRWKIELRRAKRRRIEELQSSLLHSQPAYSMFIVHFVRTEINFSCENSPLELNTSSVVGLQDWVFSFLHCRLWGWMHESRWSLQDRATVSMLSCEMIFSYFNKKWKHKGIKNEKKTALQLKNFQCF